MTRDRLDQPDNYSGHHHLLTVDRCTIDTVSYTAHLFTPADDTTAGHNLTYCGFVNTSQVFDLNGMYGAPGCQVPHLGQLLDRPVCAHLNGHPVSLCEHCATMAACVAEMRGQAYPVQTLLRQLRQLTG